MIRHGGDRTYLAQLAHCDPEEILDFSVNLHPLGMPDGLPAVLQRALNKVGPYLSLLFAVFILLFVVGVAEQALSA